MLFKGLLCSREQFSYIIQQFIKTSCCFRAKSLWTSEKTLHLKIYTSFSASISSGWKAICTSKRLFKWTRIKYITRKTRQKNLVVMEEEAEHGWTRSLFYYTTTELLTEYSKYSIWGLRIIVELLPYLVTFCSAVRNSFWLLEEDGKMCSHHWLSTDTADCEVLHKPSKNKRFTSLQLTAKDFNNMNSWEITKTRILKGQAREEIIHLRIKTS